MNSFSYCYLTIKQYQIVLHSSQYDRINQHIDYQ